MGETEKNVRDLFADAEHDQRTRGTGIMMTTISILSILLQL